MSTATARQIAVADLGAYTLRFDTETCDRCGGDGRYSYNLMDGDRCYGCGGRGTQLTKWGRSARDAYDTAIEELLTVPAGEIKVGDRMWSTTGMSRTYRWQTVVEVERTGKSAGRYRIGGEDAEWITKPEGVIITTERKGQRAGLITDIEQSVRRYDAELTTQAWNRALTLPGCWLVSKSDGTGEPSTELADLKAKASARRETARARKARAAQAKADRVDAERETSRQAILSTHPAMEILLDVERSGGYREDGTMCTPLGAFVAELARGFRIFGRLSDKQREIVEREIATATQRENERAAADPAPSGRTEVTGKVVSIKDYEGDFGTTWKMTVVTDEGYRVFVTVPRDIDPKAGQRVRFTATLTPAEDDPTFAKGSRPTGASIVDPT